MSTHDRLESARILFVALLVLALAAAASARTPVPTPADGGDGVSLYPADHENVMDLPAPRPETTCPYPPYPPPWPGTSA